MRLFISYARIDKPLCAQVAQLLDIHEVWYDQRLYAGRNWWDEILRRLEWCDVFIYLLSPDSLASEYCRKEYEIVHKLGRFVMPVLLDKVTDLPESLSELHYVDISNGFTNDAVKDLLNSLYRIEQDLNNPSLPERPAPVNPKPEISDPENFDVSPPVTNAITMIGKAAEAMEQAKFDQAVFLLRSAREKGYKSAYIDLDALLTEAEQALEQQSVQRAIEHEYLTIAELVKHKRTRRIGCQSFQSFRASNPGYDPNQIGLICNSESQLAERGVRPSGRNHPAQTAQSTRPLESTPSRAGSRQVALEWCPVPAGILRMRVDADSSRTVMVGEVAQFDIARYPITNAQYEIFLTDSRGYANPQWWSFSDSAREWFNRNATPRPPRYSGSDRPRENVSWYEAMAFCNWLSDRLDQRITLPRQAQWRRAAQGDTPRLYPWGDDFDSAYCNTRESRIRMTTLVMRYVNGVSPFGAYDMAGNVWEWCLDTAPSAGIGMTSQYAPRAVQGGSFITTSERAQIPFHFHLDPEYYYGTIGFRVVRVSY